MDFTTLARVKAHLDLTTTVGDTLLGQLIPAASLAVEKYLGFSKAGGALLTERTERYDVHPGDYAFWLRSFPVILEDNEEDPVAFEVRNSNVRDFDAADLFDEQVYDLDLDTGRLVIDGRGLLSGPGALQVVYTGGLGANAAGVVAAYPDVATATDMLVAFMYKRKDTLGLSSFSAEGGSVSFLNPDTMLPQAKALLDGLRRETYS